MNLSSVFGAGERPSELPPLGSGAILIAMTFQRLGGWFCIDSRGTRGIGKPCCAWEDAIPQLPKTRPNEQFQNEDEWLGSLKLLDALIRRMDEEDRNAIFDILASTAVDERKFTPTIDEPTRGAA